MNQSIIEDYQVRKDALKFLDVNLWAGPDLEPGFVSSGSAVQTIELAQANGICGGLITHSTAFLYDAQVGNQILLDGFSPDPFWAAAVVVPEWFFDPPSGKARLASLIKRGVRIARAFPKSGNFDFRPWNVAGMATALCDANLPLMVWQTQVAWDEIDAVCSAFPTLQLILEGNPQKILYHNRRFYALLEKHRNLKIETHNVIGFLGVEDVVARFGAQRLVFGSCLPYWDPNATMMAVTHARIPDSEKLKIARGNLEKMIASVEVPQ